MMDLNFFNIVVSKSGYTNNEEKQEGLRNTLINCGIHPMDVREADIIDTNTQNKVLETLVITCIESVPHAKDIFKEAFDLVEIEYEGLPTLV